MSSQTPTVSIILIACRMREQLHNTLLTLGPAYQRNCTARDYEVILVENSSAENLDRESIAALPANIHYFLREEDSRSPVPAINFAFEHCRGQYVGLVMDGARMLSPGVIEHALLAQRITGQALTVIPGYHLGGREQHLYDNARLALAAEQALLASVNWREDGYELFSIATFSGANRRGYLHPILECNCLFASRENFRRVGDADSRFMQPGGGSVNLHIYRSLGMLPGIELFVVPGEGSFHQFHGGVSTSGYEERDAELARHLEQLNNYWPGGFHALRREPRLLGRLPRQALPFLAHSLQRSLNRYGKMREEQRVPWPDDADKDRP